MESSSTIRLGVALRMWTFILTTVLLVSGAAAQDESKYPAFVFPANGSNLIFNKLDTVMVTFTSGFPNAILYTFCVPGTGQMIYRQKVSGFTSSVPVFLNFTSATPCWFNVRFTEAGIEAGPNSASFNIIGQERSTGKETFGPDNSPDTSSTSSSSTASATSSSTATATPSATGTGTTSSEASNTAASSPNTSNTESPKEEKGSGGLSAGASAGIGIGAAIGAIAVAGGAFWLWRRRRQRQRQQQTVPKSTELDGGDGMIGGGGGGGSELAETQMRHYHHAPAQKWQYGGELSASNAAFEMPVGGPGYDRSGHHEMAA